MATQQERLKQFRAVQDQGYELFNKKNTDYGDSFADYGVIGVIVRVSDKMRRFVSVSSNGLSLVGDEKLRDTLIDMHNYSAMAIMLLDEEIEKRNKLKEAVEYDSLREERRPPEFPGDRRESSEQPIIK